MDNNVLTKYFMQTRMCLPVITYALCFTQYGSVSNWLSAIVTTRERERERDSEYRSVISDNVLSVCLQAQLHC